MLSTTSSYLVMSANGSINVEASVNKFQEAVATHAEATERLSSQIVTVLDEIFDGEPAPKDPTKLVGIPLPKLTTRVLLRLNVSEAEFDSASQLVKATVESNPRFVSRRGPKGGVVRLS